jgi:hypothetical protein
MEPQRIEDELMEILRQAQSQWSLASEDDRDAARQRFISALHMFNGSVLDNEDPVEAQPVVRNNPVQISLISS